MSEIYGTFSTAYVEAMRLRLSALEMEAVRLRLSALEADAMRLRLSALEAENKTLRDRFSDADTERNAAQAGLKAAFARVAELEDRCKRMQKIGDMIVDEYMVEKAEKDAWEQAKEARP